MTETTPATAKSQLNKFKEAARDLECDDDDQRFKDRLAKIAAPKTDEADKANKT